MNRPNKILTEEEKAEVLQLLKNKYPEKNFKHFCLEYFVSDDGTIYGSRKDKDNYKSMRGHYKVLKINKNKFISVHRIVYYLFGSFPDGMTEEEKNYYMFYSNDKSSLVHHISLNKLDNRIDNLYLFDDISCHLALHRRLEHGIIKPEDVDTAEKLDLFVQNYKAELRFYTDEKNK